MTLHVQFFGQKSSADSTLSATRVARMAEAVRKWMTTATKILGLNLIIAFILYVLHVASDSPILMLYDDYNQSATKMTPALCNLHA